MSVQIIRGNALDLPLADKSVDLVVTSPPYFGLRSYQDGGSHYSGQIGDEATPAEFVDALIAATREMARVLKPSGSIFVNLGDKYVADNRGSGGDRKRGDAKHAPAGPAGYPGEGVMPRKSLMLLPERYRIACIDRLGLIARAVIVWDKPNGLPESVTDRVRRSHEDWVHLTRQPRYYSAVDEVREAHGTAPRYEQRASGRAVPGLPTQTNLGAGGSHLTEANYNPLGKLPGSVWTIPTQPLTVPIELGIDHFAAFPMEWPRRIIRGWSPAGVCVECGEGRRPQVLREMGPDAQGRIGTQHGGDSHRLAHKTERKMLDGLTLRTVTGYTCACPEPTAPTTPGVVLDPFGGTGTTALVADALGRHGISVDMSADYCRLARWRTTDPKQRAAAAQREYKPPVPEIDGQSDLLSLLDGEAS